MRGGQFALADEAISLVRVLIMIKDYYIYIMTNKKDGVLYVGVTNDLRRRVWEHKTKVKKLEFYKQI